MLVWEQRNEAQLREDVDGLKRANRALLADLQLMKRERELAECVSAPATGQTTHTRHHLHQVVAT